MSYLHHARRVDAHRRRPPSPLADDIALQVHAFYQERHCILAFRGALVAETQQTIRSVEAMVHMGGDVVFNLSGVDFIDEIGTGALQDLINSIHRQNGIAHFS